MGRVVSWVVMVVVGVAVILFALANGEKVALGLRPFFAYQTPELPVYLIVLVSIFIGFVAGGIVAWVSGAKARRRARGMGRHIQRLERDREEMQEKLVGLENAAAREGLTAQAIEDSERRRDGPGQA